MHEKEGNRVCVYTGSSSHLRSKENRKTYELSVAKKKPRKGESGNIREDGEHGVQKTGEWEGVVRDAEGHLSEYTLCMVLTG